MLSTPRPALFRPAEQICYGGVRVIDYPCIPNVSRLDHGAIPMLTEFHRHGIALDTAHLHALSVGFQQRATELREQVERETGVVGFNPNSGDQVAKLVFGDLKLVPPGRAKWTPTHSRLAVDDEVLKSIQGQHPIIAPILAYRGVTKLDSTYAAKLPQMVRPSTGRLHTTFRHTQARTGRLTSEDPNLQNIPTRSKDGVEIRRGFVAGKDQLGRQCVLASVDLSQIEMVLAGHLSEDETLCQAFRDGLDIHTLTVINCLGLNRDHYLMLAALAKAEEDGVRGVDWGPGDCLKAEWKAFKTNQRLPFKTVGFGLLYGQTPEGAQGNIAAQGGPFLPLGEVERIISAWFRVYRGVARWMEMQHSRAKRHGMVWDMWGRIRRIPDAQSAIPRIVNAGLRQAGNMPIQSSAQGMLKLAMAEVMGVVRYYRDRWPTERCWPLLQVHDELIFELSPNIADEFVQWVRGIMMTGVRLSVPVGASGSTAFTWGDLK